jgi:hypothetical protein
MYGQLVQLQTHTVLYTILRHFFSTIRSKGKYQNAKKITYDESEDAVLQ